MKRLEIDGREIGGDRPAYIIAEMSGNHHGRYDEAARLVRAAKEAGVDAIKLQTLTPESLTLDSDKPDFVVGKGTLWKGAKLFDLYKEIVTPWEWQPRLKKLANSLGLSCFSSPFSFEAADFLQDMGMGAYKIASFELVDLPLIRHVARKRRPMLLSTGLSTLKEISEAVSAARAAGCRQLALLKCNSAYPAPPEEMNLLTIPDMARRFDCPVGLSDHTLGWEVAVAAVALGACIVEKHFTLSRKVKGPDSAFSMEPAEMKRLVEAVRAVERARGRAAYGPTPHERASLVFRRSLYAVNDIAQGERITPRNVRSIRPGYGLAPKHWEKVCAMRARRAIERGTPISWNLLEERA
jgi:N-acetylneuraminate synthase